MEEVRCAFYRPTDPNEPFINKATQWLTGKFVHVELVFFDDRTKKHNLACGVWQSETVFFRPKTFGRTSWSFKTVKVPKAKAAAMKLFCKECAEKKLPFNKMGLLRCVTPFPRQTDGSSYFCSELAVCAFQKAGIFPTAMPGMVTPSDLWEMINNINQFADASPLMTERINQKGLKYSLHHKTGPRTNAPGALNGKKIQKKWSTFSSK
jgi:hypothetical protein